MTDEQITTMVNQFCKMMTYFGHYEPSEFDDLQIVLDKEDDGWSLNAMFRDDVGPKKSHALILEFPEMPEDSVDGMILLAGMLSTRLHKYAKMQRANAARPAEARRKMASKAGKNSWKNR